MKITIVILKVIQKANKTGNKINPPDRWPVAHSGLAFRWANDKEE